MLKEMLLSLGFSLGMSGTKEDKVLEMGFKKMSTHSHTQCKLHDAQHHNCKQRKQELVGTEWLFSNLLSCLKTVEQFCRGQSKCVSDLQNSCLWVWLRLHLVMTGETFRAGNQS